MALDPDTYERLMLKLLDEQATPEEAQALSAWLAASPNHRRQFEQMKSVWELTAESPAIPPPNKAQAWKNVATKARLRQAGDRAPEARPQPVSGGTSPWYRRNRAWLVLPVILMLTLVWQFVPRSPTMIERVASAGAVHGFNLPDETFVDLHGASRLQYAKSFNKRDRIVYLEGDAHFSVTRTGHPFQVYSGDVAIQVLGTEFSVRSQGDAIEVFVSEGQVRVRASQDDNQTIDLGPGQGVSVTNAQMSSLDTGTIQDAEDWMSRSVYFDADPFPAAVERLSRIWETPITISNPALEGETITGSIRVLPMMRTLQNMCLTLENACSVRFEDGAYFIF